MRFEDAMDCGSKIKVAITVGEDNLHIDFTGSAPVNYHNSMNANRAVVESVIIYCLRCLINEDTPLNKGVLEPIKITIPEGMLNPPKNEDPEKCAAVFCGNVEIS